MECNNWEYFDEHAKDDYEDCCYPSTVKQLLFRLEDLNMRLIELNEIGASYSTSMIFEKSDIYYSLPESLHSIYDVELAIDLVKLRLQQYCVDDTQMKFYHL